MIILKKPIDFLMGEEYHEHMNNGSYERRFK